MAVRGPAGSNYPGFLFCLKRYAPVALYMIVAWNDLEVALEVDSTVSITVH